MKTFLKISKLFFFAKNIEETVSSPSQGIDSGNEETDNEFDRNEENYDNEKFAIMAKLKIWWKVKQAKSCLTDLKFGPDQKVPSFKEKQRKKVKFGQTFLDMLLMMQSKCKFQKAFP